MSEELKGWKNTSSYSQGEKDRSPRSFSLVVGNCFTLTLYRSRHYAPDVWVAECYDVFGPREMASKDLAEASHQAKATLRAILEEASRELVDYEPSSLGYKLESWNGVAWECLRSDHYCMTKEKWEELEPQVRANYRDTRWRVLETRVHQDSRSKSKE